MHLITKTTLQRYLPQCERKKTCQNSRPKAGGAFGHDIKLLLIQDAAAAFLKVVAAGYFREFSLNHSWHSCCNDVRILRCTHAPSNTTFPHAALLVSHLERGML